MIPESSPSTLENGISKVTSHQGATKTLGLYRKVYCSFVRGRRINQVSVEAECIFWRLHASADDYGNQHADSRLIQASAAPLRPWTTDQIDAFVKELITANLLYPYQVNGEDYLHIIGFLVMQPAGRNGKRLARVPMCPNPPSLWGNPGESQSIQIDPEIPGASDQNKTDQIKSSPSDDQPKQAAATNKRKPLREGNPLYARLRERIGRDLYTHEDRNLADLAVRLDANPVIVADKPVDTETMILAAIECLPPGVEKPLAYMATVIDTARQSCTMPGSSASKAGKASKPPTPSELCAAINEGRITRCDGKPLPEGVWKYNTQRMSCDGKPFMPVNEIGGHAWS